MKTTQTNYESAVTEAGSPPLARGLSWKLNRLSRMGPSEIAYRIAQQTRAALQAGGIGRADTPPLPQGNSGAPWLSHFPTRLHNPVERYIQQADATLAGQYDVFALHGTKLGFPPQWNRDPRTGVDAPLVYGKQLDYRDSSLVGDIKYLWEPGRHLELVRVAQAWQLTGRTRYLVAIRTLVDSWLDQCPYLQGPHWVSSLELAVRLVNWSFTWHLIGGTNSPLFHGSTGQEFYRRWLSSIYQHCHFIRSHLSLFSSANNHLLGEYMGLFVGATTWPHWPQSEHWQRTGQEGMEREALRQIGEDGVNREQATWYHHEVADMLLLCALVGRANNVEFSEHYWERLENMLEYIASLMDTEGSVPMIGDSDDAIMVNLSPVRDVYRSLLATGAVLLNRPGWKIKAAYFDDKSRWLLGDEATEQFELLPDDLTEQPRQAFTDAGYFILGTDFNKPTEVRVVVDAGALGYLSLAAHGHCDALAFTLSVGGQQILVDPGTFAYHTQPFWRHYFRCTSAHNTLRIDGEEQSVPGGNFMWLRHARAQCDDFSVEGGADRFLGSHDGYRRLQDPVIHQREIQFEHSSRVITVNDTLDCKGSHTVEMYWHLGESCAARLSGNRVQVSAGEQSIGIQLPVAAGFQHDQVHGDSQLPLGWISRSFDTKQAITCIRSIGNISGTTRITTVFELPEGEYSS